MRMKETIAGKKSKWEKMLYSPSNVELLRIFIQFFLKWMRGCVGWLM